jgi:hypothetical protein
VHGAHEGTGEARGARGMIGRVLELRYGTGGGLPHTVEQTARELKIHPDFIRAMEAVALRGLPPAGRPGLDGAA